MNDVIRQVPKGIQCSNPKHEGKIAVCKFNWRHDGVNESARFCVPCADAWWTKFGATPVAKTLVIMELDKNDFLN